MKVQISVYLVRCDWFIYLFAGMLKALSDKLAPRRAKVQVRLQQYASCVPVNIQKKYICCW